MEYHFSETLKQLLTSSHRVSVFTGAGVSQESGVPTFRGKDGLWNQHDVARLATPEAFASDPRLVWEWYDWRRGIIKPIEPNPGHRAIASMEKYIEHFTLITQNIDGLHAKAGNKNVLTLHGSIWEVRCVEEGTVTDNFDHPMKEIPPRCSCGALLRPNVVWFGEPLDMPTLTEACRRAEESDLHIIVGTSGVVYPAAFVPIHARKGEAYILEVNTEPSSLTEIVNEFIQGPSGQVLPELIRFAGIDALDSSG